MLDRIKIEIIFLHEYVLLWKNKELFEVHLLVAGENERSGEIDKNWFVRLRTRNCLKKLKKKKNKDKGQSIVEQMLGEDDHTGKMKSDDADDQNTTEKLKAKKNIMNLNTHMLRGLDLNNVIGSSKLRNPSFKHTQGG